MKRYDGLSDDLFLDLLREKLEADGVGNILCISGIFEILSEHYNNDIIDAYETRRANARRSGLAAKIRAYHDTYFVDGRKVVLT